METLTTYTEDELAQEHARLREDALAAERRERILARLDRRLTGDETAPYQGQLFCADADLFSGPALTDTNDSE